MGKKHFHNVLELNKYIKIRTVGVIYLYASV